MANKYLWLCILLLASLQTESAQPAQLAQNNFIKSQIDSSYIRIFQQLDSALDKLDSVSKDINEKK